MVRDIRIGPRAVISEWSDSTLGFRLAQSALPPDEGALAGSIFAGDDLIAACDGRLLPASSQVAAAVRVAEAYRRLGVECGRDLQGEFAFLLWDRARRVLIAGCDPVGTRTLAYALFGEGLLVSSRILALLRHPRVSRRLDPIYMAHALCDWWAQPPGTTAFTAIRRIRPGFALEWRDGRTVERRVDALRFDRATGKAPAQEYYERFWTVMQQTVSDALAPPGPACVALSSGLDSSCVAIAALARGEPLHALSLVAGAASGPDESTLTKRFVRSQAGLRCDPVDCGDGELLEDFRRSAPVPDEPNLLSAAFVPAWLRLAKEARARGFRVVLDGEGGDELFWLSSRFGDLVLERDWKAVLGYLNARGWRSTLWRQVIAPRLPGRLHAAWAAGGDRRIDPIPTWMTPAFRSSEAVHVALEQRREWLRKWRCSEVLPAVLDAAPTVGSRQAMRLLDAAVGIERRSPFLDRRVVEFAGTIPAALRIDPRQPKVFLRRALEGRVPAEVIVQEKNNRLYAWLQVRGLRNAREASKLVADIPFLRERVTSEALAMAIQGADSGRPLAPAAAEQAWSVLATARWMASLGADFDVPLGG